MTSVSNLPSPNLPSQTGKKHVIRSRNENAAKSELLQTMGPDSVLIVCDWAMKFLPRRYREDQSKWFAKRRISRHIAVALARLNNENLQSLAFLHNFKSQVSQDANITTAVIMDILKDLEQKYPALTKVHLW